MYRIESLSKEVAIILAKFDWNIDNMVICQKFGNKDFSALARGATKPL